MTDWGKMADQIAELVVAKLKADGRTPSGEQVQIAALSREALTLQDQVQSATAYKAEIDRFFRGLQDATGWPGLVVGGSAQRENFVKRLSALTENFNKIVARRDQFLHKLRQALSLDVEATSADILAKITDLVRVAPQASPPQAHIYIVIHDGDGHEPTPPVWAGTDLELAKAEIRAQAEARATWWAKRMSNSGELSLKKIMDKFSIHSFDDTGKFVDCQSGAVLFDPATEQGADHE